MQPSTNPGPAKGEEIHETQATSRGPSWGLMIFLLALAMLVAFAIAWAFITPLLHRHF
jgi:hypothetical protein